MHAAQSEALRVTPSGSWVAVTMSASTSRPPVRRAAAAAWNTACLFGERLMAPLEMTQSVSDRRTFDVSLPELGVCHARLAGEARCLGEMRRGHVDADDPSGPTGRGRGEEAVGTRAAAQVEHLLAGPDVGQVEEVPDPRERFDRLRRNGIEVMRGVPEAFGERAAGLEMPVRTSP
jgi:hypothetical protein